jgi:RecA/RadA recombinase
LRAPLETFDETSESLLRIHPRVLNETIGELFLPQQISLFHGKERAPLSILAHTLAVSAARIENSNCIFLDSGANYSSNLVRSISDSKHESVELLKRIHVGQVLGLDDVVEKVELLEQMGSISLVVLDSLTGALNLTDSPGSRGRQRTLFGALDSIRRVINRLNAHVMITDHSSRNWVSGQPTPIGGNILSHAVDSVVLVDRLRQGKELVRILIERSTVFSHPPGVIVKMGSKGVRSIR